MDAPHRHLADHLRHLIVSGVLPAGVRLPSNSEMQREHGVGRGVVELAVDQLRREGLIETRRGARPEVACPPPAARTLVDPRKPWPYRRGDSEHGMRRADADLAVRLRVPTGTRLPWTRTECLGPDDRPAMLETAYRRGAQSRTVTNVIVEAYVGEFAVAEARVLGLPSGSPALRIVRTRYATDGRPVETADLILRADRWGIRV